MGNSTAQGDMTGTPLTGRISNKLGYNMFDPAGVTSKNQTPAAPDYVGAARETGQQNINLLHEQTAANRPDITTPTGGFDWTQDPATGQWSLNVTDSANQGEMRNLTES